MTDKQQRLEIYNSALLVIVEILKEELGENNFNYDAIYTNITTEFFAIWRTGQEMELNTISDDVFDDNDIIRLMFMFLVLLEQELINGKTLPEDSPILSIVKIANVDGVIETALASLALTLTNKLN